MVGPTLTLENAIDYLLDARLLDTGHVVEGDVTVEEVGGLNRNFRVRSSVGPSYFLKQSRDGERDQRYQTEAQLYRRVVQDDWAARLRPFLPGLCRADEAKSLLVLELIPPGPDDTDESGGLGLPPIAADLASALAACHAASLTALGTSDLTKVLSRQKPWALDIARPVPEALIELAPAQLQVLRLVQAGNDLVARMDELRERWEATTLIHADLKWSNILLDHGTNGGSPSVKVVDWELARMGDPAWDVGSLFQAYVAHCVTETLPEEEGSPADAADAFAKVLPLAQREMRAFWKSYRELAQLVDADAFLHRATQYCAVRLLQSAYEWSQSEARMSRSGVSILQLGLNLLGNADEAREIVLGFSANGSGA